MSITAVVYVTPAGNGASITAEFITNATAQGSKAVAVVDVETPVVSASYAHPVVKASYTFITAVVEFDTAGRYKVVTETVVVSDAITPILNKFTYDTLVFTDSRTIVVGKAVDETIIPVDYQQLNFTTGFVDSVGVDDVVEALRSAQYDFADDFSVNDTLLPFTISKAFTDTAGIEDLLGVPDGLTYQYSRASSEFVSVADTSATTTSRPLLETVSLIDTAQLYQLIDLADYVVMGDLVGIPDGLTYTFSKGVTDAVVPIESLVKTSNPTHQENVFVNDNNSIYTSRVLSHEAVVADAGAASLVSYASGDYFSQDYVGEYRQFS